jgi:hypothetical protein
MNDSGNIREYQILTLPSGRKDTVSNYELELTQIQQVKEQTRGEIEKAEVLEFRDRMNETPADDWRDEKSRSRDRIEEASEQGRNPPALVLQKMETS